MVQYRKVNKIKGNTKTEIFPAVSVEFTEVKKTTNGVQTKERIWKVGIDDNKTRKGKFCTRIASGCIQVIGVEDTDEYLKQVTEEEKKRKKVA